MKELLNKISEIIKRHEEISKLSGENFNVFNVIGVTTDEVRLHSKFLAELLNPNGSHGQGNIFLELFLAEFKIDNFEPEGAKVDIEKHVGTKTEIDGGRIDIIIEEKNKNLIIIENKIYAPDQENQLLRYYHYGKEKIVRLFYLTLFGNEPSDKSLGLTEDTENNSKKKENEIIDYTLLSYDTQIISWLKKCRKEAVQQPLLREGISHYINLIKFLTGQSINEAMNKEIVETITSNLENFKSSLKIINNINDAKAHIQWKLWKSLIEKFNKKNTFKISINKNHVTEEIVYQYYNSNRNKPKDFGINIIIEENDKYKLLYSILLDDDMYFATKIEENSDFITIPVKYKDTISKIKNLNIFSEVSEWSIWKYTEPRLRFIDFNSNIITNLADNDFLTKTVSKIAEQAINDINDIKTVLS